jgi:hypothetical protein
MGSLLDIYTPGEELVAGVLPVWGGESSLQQDLETAGHVNGD